MTDDEAYETFKRIRWSETGGEPVCPSCESPAYTQIKTRRLFKCKNCGIQYSVTSKTLYHGRKLSFRKILCGFRKFSDSAAGYNALDMCHYLDVQYKTAFVFCHKVREAIGSVQKDVSELKGVVEVDGCYFQKRQRKNNYMPNRAPKWRLKHEDQQVVIVAREREGRTYTFITGTEAASLPVLEGLISPDATIHADQGSWWSKFHPKRDVKRINHDMWLSHDGACTNQAESFYARLRRAYRGIYHRIRGIYLGAYAREAAWREDNRRMTNGEKFKTMLHAASHHPVSKVWSGYWQRSRPRKFSLSPVAST